MAVAITLEQIEILMFLEEGVEKESYDIMLRSISVQGIADAFRADPNQTSYSEAVIRRHIDGLLNAGYVDLGIKIGNTFTYFITDKGKELLRYAQGIKSNRNKK